MGGPGGGRPQGECREASPREQRASAGKQLRGSRGRVQGSKSKGVGSASRKENTTQMQVTLKKWSKNDIAIDGKIPGVEIRPPGP